MMIQSMEELNRLSLTGCVRLFKSLETPSKDFLRGIYKGYFIGPGWVRWLAKPLLTLTRMGDWRGKDFDQQGNALNLVYHQGKLVRRFPMLLIEKPSLFDRKPGLALQYAPENPFPWPWIVDELRLWKTGMLLGMSIARFGPLQRLPLPFLLEAQEDTRGI